MVVVTAELGERTVPGGVDPRVFSDPSSHGVFEARSFTLVTERAFLQHNSPNQAQKTAGEVARVLSTAGLLYSLGLAADGTSYG